MSRAMTTHTHNAGRRTRGIGFTLIEMMVAIGAVALIAVGIAAIFESVGRTVAGGRRVGALNQYAALIERQLRADFEAMTRDGVLVIHHQYAMNGQPVQSHVDDAGPRPRRIDEIVFFARGDFSSARTPVVPGFTAESSEAMVYIGHGMRMHPLDDFGTSPAYEEPQVNDGGGGAQYRPELALGNAQDPANPNRFAADWTLLRHLTVLAPPGGSLQSLPDEATVLAPLGLTRADVLDSEIQIGGQPAASSPFRALAASFPNVYGFPADFVRRAGGDGNRRPSLASGIVDVATADLAEIRRVIVDVGVSPNMVTSEDQLYDPASPGQSLFDDRHTHGGGGAGAGYRYMHQWMDDLFPTTRQQTDPTSGPRMRYEPTFPDYYGTLRDYPDTDAPAQSFRLADQRALGSSIFVPNCTEFIVEYSFGQVVTDASNPHYGALIWYGLRRQLALDGQPAYDVVDQYPFDTTSGTRNHYSHTYRKLDGTTATKRLEREMVYQSLSGSGGSNELTAHFGYHDPTYAPSDPEIDPPTLPWPWPKLIRVTMTLADPNNPSVEQTFQFIFETPEGRVF